MQGSACQDNSLVSVFILIEQITHWSHNIPRRFGPRMNLVRSFSKFAPEDMGATGWAGLDSEFSSYCRLFHGSLGHAVMSNNYDLHPV